MVQHDTPPARVADGPAAPLLELLFLVPAATAPLWLDQEHAARFEDLASEEVVPAVAACARSMGLPVERVREALAAFTSKARGLDALTSELAHRFEGAVFVPPVVVVSGRLETTFVAARELDVLADAARALCPDSDAVEAAASRAKASSAAALDASVRESAVLPLRAAVTEAGADAAELDAIVHEVLRHERATLTHEVWTGPHAPLRFVVEGTAMPCYVAAEHLATLPLSPSFEARVIAEVHPPLAGGAEERCVLRALAMARDVGEESWSAGAWPVPAV